MSVRQKVLDHLADLGICMQLTMTVARSVNNSEVGWVVDTALDYSNVKVAAFQPVTYSGRYDLPPDPMNRLTLSDVAHAVMAGIEADAGEGVCAIQAAIRTAVGDTLFACRFGLTLNMMDTLICRGR